MTRKYKLIAEGVRIDGGFGGHLQNLPFTSGTSYPSTGTDYTIQTLKDWVQEISLSGKIVHFSLYMRVYI